MRLYHGTSSKHLKQILREGILPRCVTGSTGNYDGDIASRESLVYLTSAYPIYFAYIAACETDSDLAVLAVEVDSQELLPDEDFIAEVYARQNDVPIHEVLPQVDPFSYPELAGKCLEHNGKAAIEGVPASSIVDLRVIPRSETRFLISTGMDSVPTALAYSFMGEHYRRVIEVLFEEPDYQSAAQKIEQLWSEWHGMAIPEEGQS